MWQRIWESRSAAGASVSQFVEARQALDAARGPPGADLVPRSPGGAQRPPWARLEPSSSSGAQGSSRAGPVPGQLGGSQRPPTSSCLPHSLALLLGVVRRLISVFEPR